MKQTSCKRQTKPGISDESGIALIIVLGFIAVVSVIATHLTVSSEVLARETKVASSRNHLKYVAESAAARSYWLLFTFRQEYPGVTPGQPVTEENLSDLEQVWTCDSRIHQLSHGQEFRVSARVFDAKRGIDLSGQHPENEIRELTSRGISTAEESRKLNRFLDVLKDYVDANNLSPLYGMERSEYVGAGWPDMPRNGPMQHREEALWLRDIDTLFSLVTGDTSARAILTNLQLIPPDNLRFPGQRENKSPFFSASENAIKARTDFTSKAIEEVLRARRQWWEKGGHLNEYLAPDLFSELQQSFSFRTSGIATIAITAQNTAHDIERSFTLTRNFKKLPSGEPPNIFISNWQKQYY